MLSYSQKIGEIDSLLKGARDVILNEQIWVWFYFSYDHNNDFLQ